jgi:hypothetical protein
MRFITSRLFYFSRKYNKLHELILYDVMVLLSSNSNVVSMTGLRVYLKTF